MQIAPPSRSDIETYQRIRRELEGEAGRINGRFAEVDWVPLRYLNRSFARNVLMPLYAEAQACLVTPLRDGMNLVAKEYVAAQDPEEPGVLILSEFAGAARELDAALLVNPYDEAGHGAGDGPGAVDAGGGAAGAAPGDAGGDAARTAWNGGGTGSRRICGGIEGGPDTITARLGRDPCSSACRDRWSGRARP